MYKVSVAVVFPLLLSLVASSCRNEEPHHLASCKYRFRCVGTINGAVLEEKCQGPINEDVIVDLTLENAIDTTYRKPDELDFLMTITSLTVRGTWPQTSLDFLQSTLKLEHLYLSNMQIEKIDGNPFRLLSRLEVLDLSRNNLSEIDDLFVFDYDNKIKKLKLSHNRITEIPGYVFQELTNLVELDLSNNLIQDLNEEPFSNLTKLSTLILDNNRIKNLNGAINLKLVNLKHLLLNDNHIKSIDDKTLDKIHHLETFEISNNKLNKLAPKLLFRHWDHFAGHFSCRMVYSYNDISIIYNSSSTDVMEKINKHQVDVLTHVDLSNNKIQAVQYNAFHSIINLITLDISNNELDEFVVNSEDLANIRFLNISGNLLKTLDLKTFSLMKYLINLDLSANLFEYVPDRSLIISNNLKRLNITSNDIQQVDHFRVTFHDEGGILDLSKNNLSSFYISPGEAKGLIELILHSNEITDASKIMLKHHHNLTKLDMSKNLISMLDEKSLQLPVTLMSLDLSSNTIKHIRPSAFYSLKNLRILRLSHNYLKAIEFGIFRGLSSLLNLDLAHNQITYLDSKVFLDLKVLRFLSIRYNSMRSMECNVWLSHGNELIVYVDGNLLSCDWLGTVLSNYNKGYSKMRVAALVAPINEHSLEGIPCIQGPDNLINLNSNTLMMDERLLITSQKILEAVQQQTTYLRKYIWRSVLEDAAKQMVYQN